jgi:hypothetical protein
MVPPPITTAFFTGRGWVLSGMPGTRATSRSPKKMWRSAKLCSPSTRRWNCWRSTSSPSAKGWVSAARAREQRRGRGIEGRHVGARDLVGAVARQLELAAGLRRLARPGDGALLQVALDDRVDEAKLHRLIRAHRLAGHDDLQRGLPADQPRQPLRAASPRHEAALHFRQPHHGTRRGHARVAHQGQFQPAAQRIAMDRRHHRHLAALDGVEHLGQRGRLARLVELGHLGTRREHPPRADQHDRPRTLLDAALDAREQPAAHCGAQRVDWRVRDPQHMHVAVEGVLHELAVVLHAAFLPDRLLVEAMSGRAGPTVNGARAGLPSMRHARGRSR